MATCGNLKPATASVLHDLLGFNINFPRSGVFIHMVNKEGWKYDATFTVRVDKATKNRLWEAAEASGIAPSEYIRDVLARAKLPEDLLARLTPKCRERVEKLAARSDRDAATMLMDLIPNAIPVLFDNVGYGV